MNLIRLYEDSPLVTFKCFNF